MLKKTITTGLVTGLILAGLSQGASGYSISYNQVIWQGEDAGVFDPTQLSASIDMQMVDSNTFTILLTNTTLFSENIDDFDFPATIALTGIGFNLSSNPYYDIIGGSVYGADSIYYSDGWGYDNNPLEGGPFLLGEVTTKDVDTVVSTLEAAVEPGGAFALGGKINGPKDGILPAGITKTDYITDYALITLTIVEEGGAAASLDLAGWNNLFASIDAQDVVVSFGSPTAPVPEPATMLLFGTGLAGLAGVARRRSKK